MPAGYLRRPPGTFGPSSSPARVSPCRLAEAEPTLERIFPEVLGSRELWLVFHPDVARVARVRLIIDFAAEIIGAEGPRLRGEVHA